MKILSPTVVFGSTSILTFIFAIVMIVSGVRETTDSAIKEGFQEGVKATHKEAFENGLMVKEITKDDVVVYRWVELFKLGYGDEPYLPEEIKK